MKIPIEKMPCKTQIVRSAEFFRWSPLDIYIYKHNDIPPEETRENDTLKRKQLWILMSANTVYRERSKLLSYNSMTYEQPKWRLASSHSRVPPLLEVHDIVWNNGQVSFETVPFDDGTLGPTITVIAMNM